jgi:hypothetical protein
MIISTEKAPMLRSAKQLTGYVLQAVDGEIGRCKDFLFDDYHWTIRYMVADTMRWLPGRKVLIPIVSLQPPDWASHRFPVSLTREQIKDSPPLDEAAPVSRQYETQYHRYFAWPVYWGGVAAWGASAYPPAFSKDQAPEAIEEPDRIDDEQRLRSVQEVTGYHLEATDGNLGHVEDFIVDDETWSIRYLIVDTAKWLPGRKVLIPPTWAEEVSWLDSKVKVTLTREQVKASPEYDPTAPVNREYEARLYDFYGRPHDWD